MILASIILLILLYICKLRLLYVIPLIVCIKNRHVITSPDKFAIIFIFTFIIEWFTITDISMICGVIYLVISRKRVHNMICSRMTHHYVLKFNEITCNVMYRIYDKLDHIIPYNQIDNVQLYCVIHVWRIYNDAIKLISKLRGTDCPNQISEQDIECIDSLTK
jgi:hypothetical protein